MLGEKPALSPPALHGSMMKYDAELKAGNTESAEQDERAQWHNSIWKTTEDTAQHREHDSAKAMQSQKTGFTNNGQMANK